MIIYNLLYIAAFSIEMPTGHRERERKVVADALCAINCNIYRLILGDLSGSPPLATLAKENCQ